MSRKKRNVVVLTSGGMDSAALLHYHLLHCRDNVRAIAFDYGQRHVREIAMAQYQAEQAGVPITIVNLRDLAQVLPGSSQTDLSVDVPEGHYTEESMKATVVPNRNMILLAIAIGHAIAHKCDSVSYAAHAGDHAIYPDCRPEFAKQMARVAGLCDWTKIKLLRPFVKMTKAEIVQLGLVKDYHNTWSCYKGGLRHCGKCGTCVERREAFQLAGITDPTEYEEVNLSEKCAG